MGSAQSRVVLMASAMEVARHPARLMIATAAVRVVAVVVAVAVAVVVAVVVAVAVQSVHRQRDQVHQSVAALKSLEGEGKLNVGGIKFSKCFVDNCSSCNTAMASVLCNGKSTT